MSSRIRRELHAHMGGLRVDDLSSILKDQEMDPFTKSELLCVALPTPLKELARAHYQSLILGYSDDGSRVSEYIESQLQKMRMLGLETPTSESLKDLPPYSFSLEFRFVLSKPFISRDDDAFYITDNPVRKEKVFKVPYIAPSAWKGSLRATASRIMIKQMNQIVILARKKKEYFTLKDCEKELWPLRAQNIVLFGNEKSNDENFINNYLIKSLPSDFEGGDKPVEEIADLLKSSFEAYLKHQGYRAEKVEGRQGRLRFFPTFFNKIGLEIINPHERKTGVGTKPILFESVPKGSVGKFSLLYVPFDYSDTASTDSPITTPHKNFSRNQFSQDFAHIAEAIWQLFTVYGFGAKTSSGFGVASDMLAEPGQFSGNISLPSTAGISIPLPKNIETSLSENDSIEDFINSGNEMISEEEYRDLLIKKNQNYNRKKKQLYKKVARWWEEGDGGSAFSAYRSVEKNRDRLTGIGFTRITEIIEVSRQIAKHVRRAS